MLIQNNSKAFVIMYGGKEYKVELGKNDIKDDDAAKFIFSKAKAWKLNVIKVKLDKIKPKKASIKRVTKKPVVKVKKVKKAVKTKK